MRRSRLYQTLSILAGLVVVTYLLISLYLPSARWLVFGINKRDGSVRMVEQRVTFLPPYEYYRLKFEKREGYAQRDDFVEVMSKERVPVKLYYRLRFGIAGNQIKDARRIVDQGWNAWTRARVAEAVSAVASQIPIEDLLSPTSQFTAQRDLLRQAVARHLANTGLNVTAFAIARLEVDRPALLNVKRAELRRDARSAPTRVAVFAIDGADWELLSELAADGRIPNLKALTLGGTSGSPQTIQPTISPMLWTTVATGLTPDRHGVLDFNDLARHVPVDAYTRRAPALWDIADAFGRMSQVTNWWTAWPPSAHDSTFFDVPVEVEPSAVFPPQVAARAQSLVVPLGTVNYDQVRRFLNISEAEFDAAVSGKANDPINIFRGVLAKTWTDHRVAINLYNDARQRGQDPLLLMVSYEGTDAVNHLFAPFHPPYREDINQDNYRKYWPAVANYYSEVDRLIGEWMNVLPRETTVIIVSAHGFRWGKTRPREIPTGGTALSDHRNPGVFIAYGPHVAPSRAGHAMSIYDIAPTVLTLLGLPKPTDMPGQIATWVFRDVQPITSVRVVSYSEFVGDRPVASPARLNPRIFQAELQSIGHLNDPSRNLTPVLEDEDVPVANVAPLPPEKWGIYAYYNNLGVDLRTKGKYKDAVDAFQQAVDLNPARPTPYLNLAMALFDRQQYTDGDEAFFTAIAKGLPNAENYIIDYAALYRDRQLMSRAIGVLAKGKELFPQSYLIAANLGAALVQASRFTEGVPELERALGLQPSSTLVLNDLGLFYAKHNDYARALDYWNRSLSIQPQQPQIRQAADAARSRL